MALSVLSCILDWIMERLLISILVTIITTISIATVIAMYRKIWPKGNWFMSTSYDGQIIRIKEKELNWLSPRPQQKGDFCKIDLGKERLIKRILFDHTMPNNQGTFETPLKWIMDIMSERNNNVLFGDTLRIVGTGQIKVERKHPKKIRFIQVTIEEPELSRSKEPYHWKIRRIGLREVRIPYIWEPLIYC